MKKLSHYDAEGRVRMVDVTAKAADRADRRGARVRAHAARRRWRSVRRLESPKGNPLEIARIAGIAAAKRTCGADSSLSPSGSDARGCAREAMPEWRGDHFASDGDRAHGRGDGSAGGSVRGGADDLRHVQGAGTRHGNFRSLSGEENGRAQRRVCFTRLRRSAESAAKDVAGNGAHERRSSAGGGRQRARARPAHEGAGAPLRRARGRRRRRRAAENRGRSAGSDRLRLPHARASTGGNSTKNCAAARKPGKSLLFSWPAAATSRKSCGRSSKASRSSSPSRFLCKNLVRRTKKVIDRLQLEKCRSAPSGPA